MKTNHTLAIASISCLVALINPAQSAIVANYAFDGETLASSDTSTVTATTLAVGASLAADTETGINVDGGSGGAGDDSFEFRYLSLLDDIAFDDDTLTFTITPTGGDTLDLTSITFDLINRSGGAGILATVYSSVIDGTIDNVVTDQIGNYTTGGGAGSWEPVSFDLSSHTGITGTTEFRIEFFTGGNDGAHYNDIDNIIINANIILVPEPSSTALLGLGGIALILRRRR